MGNGRLGLTMPPSLLRSAFGDAWQQAGFKVQLSGHKDGQCIAGDTQSHQHADCQVTIAACLVQGFNIVQQQS
jgi:hypothetical protein